MKTNLLKIGIITLALLNIVAGILFFAVPEFIENFLERQIIEQRNSNSSNSSNNNVNTNQINQTISNSTDKIIDETVFNIEKSENVEKIEPIIENKKEQQVVNSEIIKNPKIIEVKEIKEIPEIKKEQPKLANCYQWQFSNENDAKTWQNKWQHRGFLASIEQINQIKNPAVIKNTEQGKVIKLLIVTKEKEDSIHSELKKKQLQNKGFTILKTTEKGFVVTQTDDVIVLNLIKEKLQKSNISFQEQSLKVNANVNSNNNNISLKKVITKISIKGIIKLNEGVKKDIFSHPQWINELKSGSSKSC